MKHIVCLLLMVMFAGKLFAGKPDRFSKVDQYARNTGYYPLKALAQKLTAPYSDEESKVRSIFIWIASHISYDVAAYKNPSGATDKIFTQMADTADVAESLYWQYAWAVEALHNKRAVCSGYAALFRMLCEYSGLQAVVIEGNGRWPTDVGKRPVSNHAWNAVMINNEWKLMDVTWGSGHLNSGLTQYVKRVNPEYYAIAPERLILDHYPDSVKWTLLPKIVSKKDYEQSVFIASDTRPELLPVAYSPRNGVLNCKVGDTLAFEAELPTDINFLTLSDTEKDDFTFYAAAPSGSEPKKTPISTTPPVAGSKTRKESVPVKVKAASGKETLNIDEILDYVESIKRDDTTGLGSARPLSPKKSVLNPFTRNPYFYRAGKKIKFTYIVKRPGNYPLFVEVNLSTVLVYAVMAK